MKAYILILFPYYSVRRRLILGLLRLIMNFASISARAAGKVALSPDDKLYSAGGLPLEEAQGVSAAKFLIKGEEGMTVAITLSKDLNQLSYGEQNISLHSFTSNMPASFQLMGDSTDISLNELKSLVFSD